MNEADNIGKYAWFNYEMLMDGEAAEVKNFDCSSIKDAVDDCKEWYSVEGLDNDDDNLIFVFKLEAVYKAKNDGVELYPLTPTKKVTKKGKK